MKDEICRFGAECAFRHSIQPVKSTSCKIEAKLHSLANVVSEMAKKICNLETEFNNLKRLNNIKPDITKDVIETPKAVFKCELCGNTFNKEITLKKHINTKHVEQSCKVCDKGFKSPIEVIQQATKEQSSNIKENTSVKDKETTLEVEEEDQTEQILISSNA